MPTAISPIYLEERKPLTAVMDEALQTYIQDHLAGAAFALDILYTLESQDQDPALQLFARRLTEDLEADRNELVEMATRVGMRRSVSKEFIARMAERFCRPKLHHSARGLLGIFESLETLSLGILGKHALWCALEPLPQFCRQTDFQRLKDRALEQHQAVDHQRMRIARHLFRG